jgi:hypothetical protein
LTVEQIPAAKGLRHCTKCGRDLPESDFYTRGNSLKSWCKECFKADVISRRSSGIKRGRPEKIDDGLTRNERKKQFAVDYLGGKCSNPECGYNKCLDAMEFHHKDPEQKDFQISEAIRRYISDEEILKELDKCILLCSNCHRELHHELRAMKRKLKAKKKNLL